MIIRLYTSSKYDPNYWLCIQCGTPGWDPDNGCVKCGPLARGVGRRSNSILPCKCGSGIPEYRCVKCLSQGE